MKNAIKMVLRIGQFTGSSQLNGNTDIISSLRVMKELEF